jgi:hypothetical protein
MNPNNTASLKPDPPAEKAPAAPVSTPREDRRETSVLISLIIVGTEDFTQYAKSLSSISASLQERYAFHEILLIGATTLSEGEARLLGDLARVTPHIRYLQVDGGPDFDNMAMSGYCECIGDIVVLTSVDELPYVDANAVLRQLHSGKRLVRLRRTSTGTIERYSSLAVRAITGLEVDTRFCRTLGLNRQLLSELVARPADIHLFRFTAHKLSGTQTVIDVDMPSTRGGPTLFLRRMDLLARLVANSAPRLLRFASGICLAVAVGALMALFYIVGIWLFKTEVTEGWVSTGLLISMWMFVQLGASSVICLALSRIIDRDIRTRLPRLIDDTTISELFNDVDLLNVETAASASRKLR